MAQEFVVKIDGPVFDGRADANVTEACHQAQHELGSAGLAMMRAQISEFRHPTGRFASKLDLRDYTHASVVAAPLIYSPWLEGTGSKNRAGRFAGYRMWAVARSVVETLKRPVVETYIAAAVDKSS